MCLWLPSVLWHCWLGIRKSIRPVKIDWLSVWSEVQIVCIRFSWCHCHPQTPSSLALLKSRLVLPFWNWLTQVELEKRPLNRCSVGVICLYFVLTISKPLAEYHANNIGLHHTRNVPVGCCLSKWFFEGVQWTERTTLGLVCRAVIPVLLFWGRRSSCIQWLMQEHFYLGLWNRSAL